MSNREALPARTFKTRSFRQVTRTFRVDRRKGARMVEGRNTTRMYPELEEEDCQPLPRGRRGRKGGRESPRDGNPGKGYLLSWSLMLHYWLKMAGLPAGWLDGWLAQSWRHFNMRNYNVYLEPSGKGGWGERCTERYQCRVEHGTSQEIQAGRGGRGRGRGLSSGWRRRETGNTLFGGWPGLTFFVCPKSEGNRVIEELIRTRSAL